MNKILRNTILIAVFLFGSGIYSDAQIRIAVSKTSGRYEKWLMNADPYVVIVNMYGMTVDSALFVLSTCHGLLLTGGDDLNPAYYGKLNELSKCEDISNYRDSLEFALINRALLVRMPIFGICRGEQILNVALGGTLITDIPSQVGIKVTHRCPPDSEDCLHMVKVDTHSELYRLTKVEKGIVNSFHHQAVDMIAPGMKITALSENGVAEAIERVMPAGKSFIMGVQWHPEALARNQGLSKPLADNFIHQVKEFSKSGRD